MIDRESRDAGYDSSLWTLHQVPALARHFTVITFDNRDAGRSSRASCYYTIVDMADDLAALLDALEIRQTHVAGLSMGGMIGQEFALRHGSRLDRLVLSGCGAAPARSAFDPIRSWNWVKSRDESGEAFARELAQAIPGARLEIIAGPGSSHVVPLERPDKFNRLVVSFLSARSNTHAQGATVRTAEATPM
jgi:pimeloyl-ACP methyl ester carboxylesterase